MALQLSEASGGSFTLSKVALAIGSTTSQLSTGAAANYVIEGVWQTQKAATATFALSAPTGFSYTTVPIGSKAAFGVWLDSSGNFKVTQGPIAVVQAATDKVGPPPNPGGMAPVGVMTAYAATAAYVPGTTALTGAGVTAVYTDVFDIVSQGIA